MTKKVVVDVDAGTDDAVALLLLLALEQDKDFQLLGITCTHGNTSVDNVCRNVFITLQAIGRLDVGVYRGAEGPLVPLEDPNVVLDDFHGKDGFGDVGLPPPPEGRLQPENAVSALNRMASENPGLVLICLGPLTNVALALRTYSGFARCLGEVFVMGGNVKGVGNSSPTAEFNFYKDPEAAHILLSSLSCPLTILPWESCINHQFSTNERFNDIGSIPTAHMKLLNQIEAKLYQGAERWNPCDALLTAIFLDKGMVKSSREAHMSVELQGMYTRGQGVVDHHRKKPPNARIVEEIDVDVFKKLIFKMASFVLN